MYVTLEMFILFYGVWFLILEIHRHVDTVLTHMVQGQECHTVDIEEYTPKGGKQYVPYVYHFPM